MPEIAVRIAGPPGYSFDEGNAGDLIGQEFPMFKDGVPICVARVVAAEVDDDPCFMRATVAAAVVPEGYEDSAPVLLIEATPEDGGEDDSFRYLAGGEPL